MSTLSRLAAVLCAALVSHAAPALAQTYPSKPVRFVVPFAPGGQSDVVARIVGQKLAERWGQPVLVDNKPGAATTIGNALVAQAPADGHTMLLSPAPFVITQYAYPKLPYDGRADFSPVALMVTNPMVLVVNPTRVAARNVADFIAEARRKPGVMAYGTPGNGSLPHLAVELFKTQAGFDALHVPYKGGGPAVIDLVAGQVALVLTVLALSRVVQTFQVDARKPGPLVERSGRREPVARPPELEKAERLVTDAMASDVTAAGELRPVLADLARRAPGPGLSIPEPGRDRRRWLADQLTELERAWGLDDR